MLIYIHYINILLMHYTIKSKATDNIHDKFLVLFLFYSPLCKELLVNSTHGAQNM
jgi:hypothetical protein